MVECMPIKVYLKIKHGGVFVFNPDFRYTEGKYFRQVISDLHQLNYKRVTHIVKGLGYGQTPKIFWLPNGGLLDGDLKFMYNDEFLDTLLEEGRVSRVVNLSLFLDHEVDQAHVIGEGEVLLLKWTTDVEADNAEELDRDDVVVGEGVHTGAAVGGLDREEEVVELGVEADLGELDMEDEDVQLGAEAEVVELDVEEDGEGLNPESVFERLNSEDRRVHEDLAKMWDEIIARREAGWVEEGIEVESEAPHTQADDPVAVEAEHLFDTEWLSGFDAEVVHEPEVEPAKKETPVSKRASSSRVKRKQPAKTQNRSKASVTDKGKRRVSKWATLCVRREIDANVDDEEEDSSGDERACELTNEVDYFSDVNDEELLNARRKMRENYRKKWRELQGLKGRQN